MLTEWEFIEYEIGGTTLLGSFVYRYFTEYFMWRIKRKYKRYLGYMEYRRIEKEAEDKRRKMIINALK